MWSDTKKKQVNQIGLIPLINVIFLLLIFFLVAGTVESIDTFEVDLPASNSGAPKTHIDAIIYLKENSFTNNFYNTIGVDFKIKSLSIEGS